MDAKRQGPKTTIEWCKQYFFHWDVAFLVVCVVAIAVEPIFFYLPVINEATKCITIDTTLKIIGICVRSFLDLIALGDLVARKRKGNSPQHDCPEMKCSDYVINILSILPVPQVLVPIIFSDMGDYKSRLRRKVLNAVVLLQYVPRIFRIYRLWKIVNEAIVRKNIAESSKNEIPTEGSSTNKVNAESNKNKKGLIAMKAGFNLLLYLVASNVLGAFWYFVSIQRETTCWQLACKNDIGCSKTNPSFNCGDGFGNYTFLNDSCSVETPKTTLYDFGIFQEARQSGILASKDFFQKTMYCFWWGLRNLSSLGQNLETSSDYWENCFTVLISIFGLLLFLYFIGNLQVYMQWEASKELQEISKEISKQHDEISLRKSLPRLLLMLRKVPIFEKKSVYFLNEISKHSKLVQYNQNDYIVREGEPLDMMIFVVKGIVWTYTSNHGDKSGCLKEGDLFGEHLVKWVLESPGLSNIPLSTCTLKCHTKVEAFCLMAGDLQNIYDHISRYIGGNLAMSRTSPD